MTYPPDSLQNPLVIAQALRDAAVPDAERIAAHAEPSYRITAKRHPGGCLPLGSSRFGGSPDLPPEFEWPVHRNRPLSFLAQLDLSELKAKGLPEAGWLLFFYDVAEQPWGFDPLHSGGARVYYIVGSREALHRSIHPDVTSAGGPHELCSVEFQCTIDLPDTSDSVLGAQGIELEDVGSTHYENVKSKLTSAATTKPDHHLLGQPQLLQGDMRRECQLVCNGIYCGEPSGYASKRAQELLPSAATEWQLLLQLDTDEQGPDWHWGDTGRIYYWIRRHDLAACNFSNAWLILQSH